MNKLIELKGLDLLKIEVIKELESYVLIDIQNDSSYKEAKAQRATLNKLSKAVDTERKRITKDLKLKVDSIIKLIPIELLDVDIKEWEDSLKEEKKQAIESLYIKLGFPLQIPLDRIFNDKWLNQTVDHEVELNTWKEKIKRDLEVVKMVNESPEFLEMYYQTLEITDAKKLWDDAHCKEDIEERKITFNATEQDYQKVLNYIKSLGL